MCPLYSLTHNTSPLMVQYQRIWSQMSAKSIVKMIIEIDFKNNNNVIKHILLQFVRWHFLLLPFSFSCVWGWTWFGCGDAVKVKGATMFVTLTNASAMCCVCFLPWLKACISSSAFSHSDVPMQVMIDTQIDYRGQLWTTVNTKSCLNKPARLTPHPYKGVKETACNQPYNASLLILIT